MSAIILDHRPPVKGAARDFSRPEFRPRHRDGSATKGIGFTKTPHDVLAMATLTDASLRLWIAAQRWTWRGAVPTNAQLAVACGWIGRDGSPSIAKVKRILNQLGELGLVLRGVELRGACHVRTSLRVITPGLDGGGPISTSPRSESLPGGGSNPDGGGGSNSDPSSRRCRETSQDPPRSPGEMGGGSRETTTTAAVPAESSPPDLPELPDPTDPPDSPREMLSHLAASLRAVEDAPARILPRPMPARPPGGRRFPGPLPGPGASESPRTADQERFLSGLRPELLRVLESQSPRVRESLLRNFTLGAEYDVVCRDMTARLEGQADRDAQEASRAWRRLGPEDDAGSLMEASASGDPAAPLHLAERLARDFDDRKSRRAFEKLGRDLASGARTLDSARHAYRKAMGPRSKNRGAVFMVELRRARE